MVSNDINFVNMNLPDIGMLKTTYILNQINKQGFTLVIKNEIRRNGAGSKSGERNSNAMPLNLKISRERADSFGAPSPRAPKRIKRPPPPLLLHSNDNLHFLFPSHLHLSLPPPPPPPPHSPRPRASLPPGA